MQTFKVRENTTVKIIVDMSEFSSDPDENEVGDSFKIRGFDVVKIEGEAGYRHVIAKWPRADKDVNMAALSVGEILVP